MSTPPVDLDLLARELQNKMREEELSLRTAADEIGCSPATLSRVLRGSAAPSLPDTENLFRAVSWLGKSLSDFENGRAPSSSSFAEVELHLRALPGVAEKDKEALVAIVRAAHDAFKFRKKKG
jgi:transcriptional regulator with XRE-family HTH domain